MKIAIGSLTVPCVIGDLPEEREREQPLLVDAEIEIGDDSSRSDRLADTVDYSALAQRIAAALKSAKCRMLERAAKIAWDVCVSEKNAVSAKVRVTKTEGDHSFATVTIHEGRNRQVRRMFEVVGSTVMALKRIGFGPLQLDDLPRGRWRYLTEAEIRSLKKLYE